MTRTKVNLTYIKNDATRKTTFKKRKKGLIKKVYELSTLCAVDACAIIFSSYDSEPEVWPSNLGVQRVIARFRKMPELEQSKKMVNQESFSRNRLSKTEEQLRRLEKENRSKEIIDAMYQCLNGGEYLNMSLVDLNELGWLLNQNLKEIERRIEFLRQGALSQGMAVMNDLPSTSEALPNAYYSNASGPSYLL